MKQLKVAIALVVVGGLLTTAAFLMAFFTAEVQQFGTVTLEQEVDTVFPVAPDQFQPPAGEGIAYVRPWFSQKIFYFHVPVAISSFLVFFFTAYYGVRFLMTRDKVYDTRAKIATEVTLLFVILTLITGDIWTRYEWGAWWVWEPRLTTYFIMTLLVIAYFVLRNSIEDEERRMVQNVFRLDEQPLPSLMLPRSDIVWLDLDEPITKTSTGVVVLPQSHHYVERKLRPAKAQAAIGKSACDQCRYCTEYCPRFLLGYDVQPHAVMRSLAFTGTGADYWNPLASLCCSCGLCTLYACPEELYPKEACDDSKAAMRQANQKWTGPTTVKPHPMRDGRRVPIQSLMKKLDIRDYDAPAQFEPIELQPRRAVLPLKQNAGSPTNPLVKAGDKVSTGQKIGEMPDKALGAPLHAPFAGTVESVTEKQIILVR